MQNPRMTVAYKTYYDNVLSKNHNNPELIARWGNDPARLETQILCFNHGRPIEDSKMFEDKGEVFGPARWPYNAKTEPNYSNPPIQYIIGDRMQCIGSTWWNWKERHSEGLGFDFDTIAGHADGIGISDKEMAKLDKIDVPWLEVIRSTRGGGRHLYIWFQEPYPVTMNHDEHAALARSFIPLIAKHTGFDCEANVDVCGGNMWFHHVEATKENRGYSQVKPATQILTDAHVPPNWRDHLEVVSGGRTKVRVQGWTSDGTETEGDELDEMTQAHSKIELDEIHLRILEELEETGHTALWVPDHHLWQGHTGGLKEVYDKWAANDTPMKGLFDTNSHEQDRGKPNCFMRPKANGGWDVYRFGEAVECELWGKQGKWTHTTYNFPATLRQIAMACGGFEGPDPKQGFIFSTAAEMEAALVMLGSKITLPVAAVKDTSRTMALRARESDGKIVLVISKKGKDEPGDWPRFAKTTKGWERVIDDAIDTSDKEQEDAELWTELDDKFRALKIGDKFDDWVLRDHSEKWTIHPRENVKAYLMSQGIAKVDPVIGAAVFKAWQLTNDPFAPEYPGGRKWNRNAAQLKYAPREMGEDEAPHHPNWDRVMNHCGTDLDEYILDLPWTASWGIRRGGDYLTAWIACMLRQPQCKLPYLFMYGPQNSGKSIFHEAISELMTKGVVKADRALTSKQGYNGELMDAVLAVVDEVNISKSGGMEAYDKLKEWTTGMTVSIHAKYKQVQEVASTLHFVQMANNRSSLPVFPGDTRVTAFNVPSLEEDIPKDVLLASLRKEAPDFMRTLVDQTMPEALGRMRLPVIETRGKQEAVIGNMNPLELFIQERCHMINGGTVLLKDFRDRFWKDLDQFQKDEWSSRAIKDRLSETFPIALDSRKNVRIGNLSFTKCEPTARWFVDNNKLVQESAE